MLYLKNVKMFSLKIRQKARILNIIVTIILLPDGSKLNYYLSLDKSIANASI